MNRKLLITIFISLFLVLKLHILAITHFLYWKYWWFDNLVHFLGGLSIALIAVFYTERFSFLNGGNVKKFLIIALVGSFVASIIWEVFEYKAGIPYVAKNYSVDTQIDILMGLIGALCGGFLSHSLRIRK